MLKPFYVEDDLHRLLNGKRMLAGKKSSAGPDCHSGINPQRDCFYGTQDRGKEGTYMILVANPTNGVSVKVFK